MQAKRQDSGFDKALKFGQEFMLGGLSGAVSKTATAPIERVKLLIQTNKSNPRVLAGEIAPYTTISNTFKRVYVEEGVRAFWQGNGVNVLRYFPTQAFNFAFKDAIKAQFPRYNPNEQFGKFVAVQVASGGLAGAGSLCFVYPLDLLRTRLAADVGKTQFKGPVDCLIKTANGPRGVRGLYSGFGMSVAGIVPFRGTYFGLFDTLDSLNPYRSDRGLMGLVSTFGAAQTAAIAAAYASYPFDTVRRALQMQAELPVSERMYKGAADCVLSLYKQGGFGLLYRGAAANALRTLGSALVLVLYKQATLCINDDS